MKREALTQRNYCSCGSFVFPSKFSLKTNPNLIYLTTVMLTSVHQQLLTSAAKLPSKFSRPTPQHNVCALQVSTTTFLSSLLSAHSPLSPWHTRPQSYVRDHSAHTSSDLGASIPHSHCSCEHIPATGAAADSRLPGFLPGFPLAHTNNQHLHTHLQSLSSCHDFLSAPCW